MHHLWPDKIQRIISFARRYLDSETRGVIDINDDGGRLDIAEKMILQTRYDYVVVHSLTSTIASKTSLPGNAEPGLPTA